MTNTQSEHAASHTWDGERCSACGVGLHGTASIMVCDPDRMAKGLAKINETGVSDERNHV
jgi:hypothetical protein